MPFFQLNCVWILLNTISISWFTRSRLISFWIRNYGIRTGFQIWFHSDSVCLIQYGFDKIWCTSVHFILILWRTFAFCLRKWFCGSWNTIYKTILNVPLHHSARSIVSIKCLLSGLYYVFVHIFYDAFNDQNVHLIHRVAFCDMLNHKTDFLGFNVKMLCQNQNLKYIVFCKNYIFHKEKYA